MRLYGKSKTCLWRKGIEIDVASQGRTKTQALENLSEAITTKQ